MYRASASIQSRKLLPERKCDPSRWVLTTPQANLRVNADYLNPPSPEVVTLVAGAYHVMINAAGKLETGLEWIRAAGESYQSADVSIAGAPFRTPSAPATPAKHVDPNNEKLTFVTASQACFIVLLSMSLGTRTSGAIIRGTIVLIQPPMLIFPA